MKRTGKAAELAMLEARYDADMPRDEKAAWEARGFDMVRNRDLLSLRRGVDAAGQVLRQATAEKRRTLINSNMSGVREVDRGCRLMTRLRGMSISLRNRG